MNRLRFKSLGIMALLVFSGLLAILPEIGNAAAQTQAPVHIVRSTVPIYWAPALTSGSNSPYWGMINRDLFYSSGGVLFAFMGKHGSTSTSYNYSLNGGVTWNSGGAITPPGGSPCSPANSYYNMQFTVKGTSAYYFTSSYNIGSGTSTFCENTGTISGSTITWAVSDTSWTCLIGVCTEPQQAGGIVIDGSGNIWTCSLSWNGPSFPYNALFENGVLDGSFGGSGYGASYCGLLNSGNTILDLLVPSAGTGQVYVCNGACSEYATKPTGGCQYSVGNAALLYACATVGDGTHTEEDLDSMSVTTGVWTTIASALVFPKSGITGLSSNGVSAFTIDVVASSANSGIGVIYTMSTSDGGSSWSSVVNATSPSGAFTLTGSSNLIFGGPYVAFSGSGTVSTFGFLSYSGPVTTSWFAAAGPPFPSTFMAMIKGLDCGNCIIAGSATYYEFVVNITSVAINPINFMAPISEVVLSFNDSVHQFQVAYNNVTQMTTENAITQSLLTLGPSQIHNYYNSTTGVRSMGLVFFIQFSSGVLQAANRALYLQGCLGAPVMSCTGTDNVNNNYFNILNQGGLVNTVAKGGCAHIAGGDVFSDTCHYTASAASIMTNSTWVDLQSYSTQFSYTTNNTYVWQQYQGGANPSSNHKDWTQTLGFFYYDGTTWVKGPSVVISMLMGNEGGNNEWTLLNTVYYFGSTLISNQSISVWIGQATVASPSATGFNTVGIFVDIWYSSINASTTWGMRTNAYYVGMHNTGTLFSNWNPLYGNQSTSEAFGTLKDHTGAILSSTQIQCTKVFSILNRLGVPGVHAKQPNFIINTIAFNVQQFNLAASFSQMGGVNTPVYTQPLVPIISSSSNFLAPIYAVIAGLAGFIVKALVAEGALVWNALGSQFPWFTSFVTIAGSLITEFFALFLIVTIYLIEALSFLYSIISFVTVPITIIQDSWATITAIYTVAFKGVPLTQVIELFIIVVFGLSVMEAAFSGDFPYLIRLAQGAYKIVYEVMWWSYLLVKFFVDAVENLIP